MDKFFKIFTRVFGSRSEREIRKLMPLVQAVAARADFYTALSDAELRAVTDTLKARLADGATLDDILVDAFAVVREMSTRTPAPGAEKGLRHFDVQILGGIVLHQGKISEMTTGEGKTLVATCPAYLNALSGRGVHVITVNDYLARRDREWMGPIYERLGLKVGVIQAEMGPAERKPAYDADITFGTNNEFGFDYLRDNMKSSLESQVQRRNFAILDEVDNILIDEARTPLIISGPSEGDTWKYGKADSIARRLIAGSHFEVKEKEQHATLTEDGIEEAQKIAGVDSFYSGRNMEWPHLIEQALRAHHIYKCDVDYVVQPGESGQQEVVIVDEFTGRLMSGRRWGDGLHQAVEAKERIAIRAENQTLATITFQNFFKLYDKLAGMTGTAITEAAEFMRIYGLDVVPVPTNRPMVRADMDDLLYATERAKFTAVVTDILEKHTAGRPVLVGTTSIEKSEQLSEVLTRKGIQHEVLNAKHHAREAEIIAKAGQAGRVTIATNMAGRGTDIKLGPEVTGRGGLHVLGTERHEARRIDNQLRGRSGRQGDPGSTRFYLSLEDDLMRRFAGPKIIAMLHKLGLRDDEVLTHSMVTRSVERAQKKVEERNFDIRKRLLEYDEVMNEQRTLIYDYRQQILRGDDLRGLVERMVTQSVDRLLARVCPDSMKPSEWDFEELLEWWRRRTGLAFEGELPRNKADLPGVIGSAFMAIYDKRAEAFGEELSTVVARFVLLNAFDLRWKEQLYQMDALKSGIGLRAYGNEDPKVAYKREGYQVFEAMLRTIEDEVVEGIVRIEIAQPSEAKRLETAPDVWAGGQAKHESMPRAASAEMERASGQNLSTEAPKPFKHTGPQPGRNDVCYCGSGLKFKRCHGVNA
ncbi:MAG: preprotein translocase subunit SecA [Planctomycetes bacterium]|nr:preprotein translocase subunit SecA [Planctomycetota bacterium]